MTQNAKSILSYPVKTTLANTDQIVCVSNVSSNSGNLALISVGLLFSNTPAHLVQQPDPPNATAWQGPQGVIFFSNNYGYVSIATNTLRRFAISSF